MYSMIIPLNLYNKYFKSIIHYLYNITRTERLELPMIDLKSIVLPIKLYPLYNPQPPPSLAGGGIYNGLPPPPYIWGAE